LTNYFWFLNQTAQTFRWTNRKVWPEMLLLVLATCPDPVWPEPRKRKVRNRLTTKKSAD